MEEATNIGLKNRTGLQMHAALARELVQTVTGGGNVTPPAEDGGREFGQARADFVSDADPIGTMPAPTTAKGVAKSGIEMLKGGRPQVFIDKLAERAAFERGGTRLYDSLLVKLRNAGSSNGSGKGKGKGTSTGSVPNGMTEARVLEIRKDEAAHFALASECIERLGGDPTAETPSADLVSVETLGFVQAISDARTSLGQSLHVVLAAELIDHAAWELLIELARGVGQDKQLPRFQEALRDEQGHLRDVRSWYTSLTMSEMRIGAASG
ncbi:MAG: ferritin-like domain-containing protein [Steroidobacteraceae bacterium]